MESPSHDDLFYTMMEVQRLNLLEHLLDSNSTQIDASDEGIENAKDIYKILDYCRASLMNVDRKKLYSWIKSAKRILPDLGADEELSQTEKAAAK